MYGAYLAYTDNEIGRVIQTIQDLGELDNTLIIYISGDNGASAEGMLNGTPNEFTTFNGVAVPVKDSFSGQNSGDRTKPSRTLQRLGRGLSTRRSSGANRWPRIAAARRKAFACRGLVTSRTWAASGINSITSSILCRRFWK